MENKVKKAIKYLLLEEDYNFRKLVNLLHENNYKEFSYDSFVHRLGRGTITYNEMFSIADILGYEIKFVKKNN